MHDDDTTRWEPFIADLCAALGVERAQVDVTAILDLTRRIAHLESRPMAPVGAFIAGLALGRGVGPMGEVTDRIDAVLGTD